ncbi:putative bacteriophage holin [Alcanivorax sp. S71-1-4]|uniref:phage holin, lambda family n=1 Tax=Alcanivorax sp. S71-1-4 TaxID=1177159 RepID=UPI001356D900|nr:phage holin, lambda family [Alcanivorax sp. S71-1-4]KAF0810442.1 putative bacteriophage holin [Alcanivorax sp. S71-1-4]
MGELWQKFQIHAGHGWVAALATLGGLMSYIYHHYGADVPFDWKRWLLEGLMCGFIGLTFSYGLRAVGLPQDVASFVGCAVGCIGVQASTELLKKLVRKRAGIDQ